MLENKTGAWAQPFALKQTREPGLNRVPVVDFFQFCINMLINHQPLEAFLVCCTLVNTGAWASTVPMEGPGSASLKWKGLGPRHLFW